MSDEAATHVSQGNPAAEEAVLPGVKHIIAVASGKGGVGKSTVSANVAVALAQTGAKVGLMDADIYGPNIPMMMGVPEPPEKEGDKIKPAEAHGVKIMSMGFFVPEETAIVWRGPMVHTAIQQFFRDVLWGRLGLPVGGFASGDGGCPTQSLPDRSADRRRDGDHAPGSGTLRRPQGPDDVQESKRPSLGRDREHEFLRLRALRRTNRNLLVLPAASARRKNSRFPS